MKTTQLILLSFFVIASISCTDNKKAANTSSLTRSDTIGYYAARNLEGLGSFQIGKSTYSKTYNLLKSEFRNDRRYDYMNLGQGNGELFTGLLEIKYDTTKSYQDIRIFPDRFIACKSVKALGLYEYYIADIEISSLLLTFFRDTLIRIDCRQDDKIDKGFTQKYGTGKVTEENIWKTPFGETNKRPNDNAIRSERARLSSIFDQIIWENPKVKATSYTHISYNTKSKKSTGADFSIYEFSIVSKDERKNKEMTKCDSTFRENYNQRREMREKEKLNKL